MNTTTGEKKLKVVWICHFSNRDVREKLDISCSSAEMLIRKILKKPLNNKRDFAPWINNLIKEFERFKDVELHIIAPHSGMREKENSFNLNGVNYHFFRPQGESICSKIKVKITNAKETNFYRNRIKISKFISEINPDIINLIGAEIPRYSIAVLDVVDIPVYLSCQTVYSNPQRKIHSNEFDLIRWNLELQIHRKLKYFGCLGRMHRDLVLKNNCDAIILKNFFPIQRPGKVEALPKKYDFVYFGGITKQKGIIDALEALAFVKKVKEDASLNVVGACSSTYKKYLLQKISELGIEGNVTFNDYFPVHSDMHQHITQGRCAVLPIKLDVTSSALKEAMLLEIPVVTYKTSGTPYLNKDGECVLISDIDDVQGLAENMIKVIQNPDYAKNMAIKAKAFVEKEFDNTMSAKRLLADYYAVLDHYHSGIPIPEELLFNTDEFPIYN